MRITDQYIIFYRENISQWHMLPTFDPISKITFSCSEQWMMWYKAMLFGDKVKADEILNATHPSKHQALGRLVKGYDQTVWNDNKYYIVFNATFAKFTQHVHLLKQLLDYPKDKKFVEASPVDKVWGIGMGENDPGVEDEKNWKGENLLGQAITEVRDRIQRQLGFDLSYYEINLPENK